MEWKCYISVALFSLVAIALTYLVVRRHTSIKGTPREPLLKKSPSVVAAAGAATTARDLP